MTPLTDRRWRLRETDAGIAAVLSASSGISPAVARILASRGIDSAESAGRFVNPSLSELHDPYLLAGMERAVDRLVAAIHRGETVCVYGDYDVDGITAVSLLISFFRELSIHCFYHIPLRLEDGYGLSVDGLRAVATQGAQVIVTVDCGVSASAEAEVARALGLDLIITDHHTIPETLPIAYSVINPLRKDSAFPCRYLAGVGVAFNLMIALRSRLREAGYFSERLEPDLRTYLDLVALGTIADIVPLLDENRILVRYGLKVLETSRRPGIQALKAVAGVTGEVTCGSVGFRLAPRLNAAGRLEDAALGVELLLSDDPAEASRIASELDVSNAERQNIEREILQDALKMISQPGAMQGRSSIVLASAEWHPGVIGIVASRIVDLYHRPTVLIALQDGSGRGSGRSIPGFHLYQALQSCSDHLLKFGGHRQAAGLAIDEATLQAFVERFDEVTTGELSEDDLVPELLLDGELSAAEVTIGLVEEIASLQPFGMGNPEPIFLLKGANVVETRILKGEHLKMRISSGGKLLDAIAFGMAGRLVHEKVDLAVSLQINEWNGRNTLQLRVKDMRHSLDDPIQKGQMNHG